MRVWSGISSPPQPLGVAGAVELLVVAARVEDEVLQVVGPGDLAEEPIGLGDVRLDLGALVLVQRAARELEVAQLVGHEIRRFAPVHVAEGTPRDRDQLGRGGDHGDGGFVRQPHDLAKARELGELLRELVAPSRAMGLELQRPLDQVEARHHPLPQDGRKLLRLHEHVLADRDLSQVVQQRGIVQLAELRAREADVAVAPSPRALEHLRQSDGERGHASNVRPSRDRARRSPTRGR